jgi:hypothetical protein
MHLSKEQLAQIEARHQERREQRRLAQARYRARYAKRNAKLRVVVNILSRQRSYHDDFKRLATALHDLIGASAAKELVAELRAAMRQRKKPRGLKPAPKQQRKA